MFPNGSYMDAVSKTVFLKRFVSEKDFYKSDWEADLDKKLKYQKMQPRFVLKLATYLTLSNLGLSIPLSNLGGWRNPPELNNSGFLWWISIKLRMRGYCRKTNLNINFEQDRTKDGVTATS